SVPNGSGTPTGMVTFYDGTTPIGQVSLNASGQATLTTNLGMAVHEIFALYASDTKFAASSAQIEQIVGPTLQFSSATFSAGENAGHVDVQVTLAGSSSTPVTVDYITRDFGDQDCSVNNGFASLKCDYQTTSGQLIFNPGEGSKTISISLVDDAYAEGNETFNVVLSNPSGASLNLPSTAIVIITDNDPVNGTNPIDQAGFFVRQHYLDFLNREPDTDGFNFWTDQINSCGSDAQCIEIKRINVSAAFFLSIEFQETGYLVYRIHKAAFGTQGQPVPIMFGRFLIDTQQVQKDVRVGIGNWQAQLEANKQAYALAFVQQNVFLNSYPSNLSANQVVAIMDTNAGGVLSQTEFDNLVAILGATPNDVTKRAQVLRAIAEDEDLKSRDFNRAFVLMQYFGYLRRNPNDLPDGDFSGFNFWLGKLNQFNGNFINADMVKSFLISGEYRHRFGP
ncbi:MAG TPA: Calx-beta domain-containing protein, partial [Pyrinomonadaceae bacterium]